VHLGFAKIWNWAHLLNNFEQIKGGVAIKLMSLGLSVTLIKPFLFLAIISSKAKYE
jgi:hypothetical protein